MAIETGRVLAQQDHHFPLSRANRLMKPKHFYLFIHFFRFIRFTRFRFAFAKYMRLWVRLGTVVHVQSLLTLKQRI